MLRADQDQSTAPDVIITYGVKKSVSPNGLPIVELEERAGLLRFNKPLPVSAWVARLVVSPELDEATVKHLAQRLFSMGLREIKVERSHG